MCSSKSVSRLDMTSLKSHALNFLILLTSYVNFTIFEAEHEKCIFNNLLFNVKTFFLCFSFHLSFFSFYNFFWRKSKKTARTQSLFPTNSRKLPTWLSLGNRCYEAEVLQLICSFYWFISYSLPKQSQWFLSKTL